MALMGLDNVEWAANILNEARREKNENKENKGVIVIKTKKELNAELSELIRKCNNKEITADVVFNFVAYINLHYPFKKVLKETN